MTRRLINYLLRCYFAAHAPADVPTWFAGLDDPAFGPPMPSPLNRWQALNMQPAYNDLPDDDKSTLAAWLLDGHWDLDEPLASIGAAALGAMNAAEAERCEAMDNRLAERWYAWRWFYADAMVRRSTQA